jgi:molybdopterin molybdotransferase
MSAVTDTESECRLLVMAKEPVPGRVKTRLCPPCTLEEAALVAEAALDDTLSTSRSTFPGRVVVMLDGEPGPWLPLDVAVLPQRAGDLADRLAGAFGDAGAPALAIAGDTPQVTPALLTLAATQLLSPGVDAVLGPTEDGGYWVIGLRRADPAVFTGIPMSALDTAAAQRERLDQLGLRCVELPSLRDVDTFEDAVAVAGAVSGSRFSAMLWRVKKRIDPPQVPTIDEGPGRTSRPARRAVSAEELATPLLAYPDARARILASFQPLPAVDVPLAEAVGLTLAEPVVAGHDVPGFANSAMDGYAVRSADLRAASAEQPIVLRVSGDLPAGAAPQHALEAGTAARIMTGAPLPPGADAVVPWEDVEGTDEQVLVPLSVSPGRFVRPRGEDVAAGQTVLEAGEVVRPIQVGVLASLGQNRALVHRPPRVAVLSTGEELVAAGEALRPGQVHDANGPLLTALCEAAGGRVVMAEMVGDDPSAIQDRVQQAVSTADVLVTSGGASVGEHDWLRDVLSRTGQLSMWRVAIKPGKPIGFGSASGVPVFLLPGNPGSAFVCAHAFVLPAVRTMAGRHPDAPSLQARLGQAVSGSPERTFFCPVRLDGELAHPLPPRSSAVLSHLRGADGFAVVPAGGLSEAAAVRVERLA